MYDRSGKTLEGRGYREKSAPVMKALLFTGCSTLVHWRGISLSHGLLMNKSRGKYASQLGAYSISAMYDVFVPATLYGARGEANLAFFTVGQHEQSGIV